MAQKNDHLQATDRCTIVVLLPVGPVDLYVGGNYIPNVKVMEILGEYILPAIN